MKSFSQPPQPSNRLRIELPKPRKSMFGGNRIRLYFLFGSLILVVVAMRYAGNPNNWRWLTNAGQKTSKPLQLQELNRKAFEQDKAHGADWQADSARQIQSEFEESRNDPLDARPDLSHLSPDLTAVEQDFWTRCIDRLDDPSRETLYTMVFRESGREPEPVDPMAATNVLDRIAEFSQSYATQFISQADNVADSDTQQRQAWYDLLFDWQQHWKKETEPALRGLVNVEAAGNRDAIGEISTMLDEVARSLVVDGTKIPNPSDHLFVLRLLQQIGSTDVPAESAAQSVTQIQLANQPEFYRGKLVTFRGRIRAARSIPSRQGNEFYELWVQPSDGATIPLCVFVTHLPNEFNPPGPKLTTMDLPTEIIGYFFKVRSYLTPSKHVQFCPTLFAFRPRVFIDSTPTALMPAPWLLAALAMVGVGIAVVCARLVYRGSLPQPKVRPVHHAVEAGLAALRDDPQVETVLSRLEKLEETKSID